MKKLKLILLGVNIGISIINHLKIKKIMAKQDQFNLTLGQLNEATNSLAAKIQRLIDGQTVGDTVTQESLDQLQLIANQLTAMGADETNPLPEEPPIEEPPIEGFKKG